MNNAMAIDSPLFRDYQLPSWGLDLAEDEIQLWSASLDLPPARVAALHELLDAEEQRRARRFVFEHSRRRFTVARGLLRQLLGAYTGVAPGRGRFRYGQKGKPLLAEAGIEFNISHSEELLLVGFCKAPLGVDVEYLREVSDAEAITQRFFSSNETLTLLRLDKPERPRAFLLGWTRKEAYIKATGRGLSFPLSQFEVTMHPHEPPRILSMDGDTVEAARWTLLHLEPAPGYVGAAAVAGRDWRVSAYRLGDGTTTGTVDPG